MEMKKKYKKKEKKQAGIVFQGKCYKHHLDLQNGGAEEVQNGGADAVFDHR